MHYRTAKNDLSDINIENNEPTKFNFQHNNKLLDDLIIRNDTLTLNYVLDTHLINVNARTSLRETALHCAAKHNRLDCLQILLLQSDVNVNAQDLYGDSALHTAALKRRSEAVKLLLTHPDINVNITNSDGNTPLQCARLEQYSDIVLLIFAHKSFDSAFHRRYGCTRLHLVAQTGIVDMLNELLTNEETIDVNVQDDQDRTPLFLAARNGHADCVKRLLSQTNINPNIPDCFGDTPLLAALAYTHADCARLLLTQADNIDINTANINGPTALHLAVSNGDVECVKLILQNKSVNVNAKDERNETPLSLAQNPWNSHSKELVALLTQHGATEDQNSS